MGDVLVKLPQPKEGRTLPANLAGTVGAAGNKIFAGLILDDYNPALAGLQAVKTYDQMRRSEPMVQAVLLACELPIRGARWYIEPASDDPTHVGLADFIHDALFSFGHQTFDDFLRFALGMFWAGYSWSEKIFAYDERGYLMWDQFADRLADTVFRWNMDPQNEDRLATVLQLPPPHYQLRTIPAEKVLVHTFRKEGNNFQGNSLLRSAYKPWFILQYLEKVANIGFERMAGGLPVMEIPEGAEQATVDKAVEIVESLRMGDEQAGVTYPEGLKLEILEIGGKMMDHLQKYLEDQRLAISRSALAAFMNMPGANVGSFGLSRDQSQLFLDSLSSSADQFASTFNLYAIPQLLDLNFRGLKREDYPRLEHSRIGQRDVRWFGRSLGELARYGLLTPGVELEEHIREILDLPDIPEEQLSLPVNNPTVDFDVTQARGKTQQPAVPPASTVPAPANMPQAKVIASQPWRPSTRLRRMTRAYEIRRMAERSREELNGAAEREVDRARTAVSRAMSRARKDAKAVLEQHQGT